MVSLLKRSCAAPACRAVLCAGLLCLALSACGGGGTGSAPPAAARPDGNTQLSEPAAPIEEARNTLTASQPALQRLAPGAEFSYVLSASFRDALFQGSARLLYNSNLVSPIEIQRGSGMPAGNIFLGSLEQSQRTLVSDAADRAAGFDRFLPLAFTGRPGSAPLPAGRNELLRIRFRLLSAPGRQPALRLKNSPEFLQLRDARGLRLPFNFESSSAVTP